MSADFLDQLEAQLVASTTTGELPRARRARRRAVRLISTPLAVASIAVAATGVAIAATFTGPLLNGHAPSAVSARSHHPRSATHGSAHPAAVPTVAPPPASSIPVGGPVPPGFQPQSFTAISEYTWWLMGPAPCSSPPCTSIVRTVNGGASFVGLPAPRTDQVSQLRFADESDGYAFGDQLWSTHDGGENWAQVPMPGSVDQLAAANGYVYALVDGNHGWSLMRSPANADNWETLYGSSALSSLWVQGNTVVVQSGDRLLVSTNDGLDLQPGANLPAQNCSFDATVDASTIWAACNAPPEVGTLSRSTDAGKSFTSYGSWVGPVQSFGAFSATGAVAGSVRLFRTVDGGRTWQLIPGLPKSPIWSYIGFTDATHGVAVGEFGGSSTSDSGTSVPGTWRLYYTTDAGTSYHYVPITP
jgi:photosystem II stability/assembly factor-like uncharacterized protein